MAIGFQKLEQLYYQYKTPSIHSNISHGKKINVKFDAVG